MKNISKYLNRKEYIVFVISLLVILLSSFSYAYFSAFIFSPGTANNTVITTGRMEIEFSDGDEVQLNNAIPGDKIIKRFKVKNIGTVSTFYDVYLSEVINNFRDRSDLVFRIRSNDGGYNSQNDVEVPLTPMKIINAKRIDVGAEHNYELEIEFLAKNENQDDNKNVDFSGVIRVNEVQKATNEVTLHPNGGTIENERITLAIGEEIGELPTPIKEDYEFLGWFLDEELTNKIEENTMMTSNIHDLYAKIKQVVFRYDYTGSYQEFSVPYDGEYIIELWGASSYGDKGKGGYTSGKINLNENQKLYVYTGQKGDSRTGGFNGGGSGRNVSSTGYYYGGGATDIRYFGEEYVPTTAELSWNNTKGLSSRVMVAGGGGASNSTPYPSGGGLKGYNGVNKDYTAQTGYGGSQTAGGTVTNYSSCGSINGTAGGFGYGGTGGNATQGNGGGFGGGAGYYGGAGSSRLCAGMFPSGGGSSFISGHTGCVAITSASSQAARKGTNNASCATGTSDILCSNHYSGFVFTDTKMIDGNGYAWTNVKGSLEQIPNPTGDYYDSGVGHIGNGYAKITFVEQ